MKEQVIHIRTSNPLFLAEFTDFILKKREYRNEETTIQFIDENPEQTISDIKKLFDELPTPDDEFCFYCGDINCNGLCPD